MVKIWGFLLLLVVVVGWFGGGIALRASGVCEANILPPGYVCAKNLIIVRE